MSRWLLLLGSNLADDARVRAALEGLQALGRCEPLGPIRHLRPAGDGCGRYYNALATLEHPGGDALRRALQALQARLGREPGHPTRVAIDIDLLARQDDAGRWQADPHAAAKPDTWDGPIADFIAESGVVLHPPAPRA